ncbi:OmpA family protein [Treponema sp.]|uniref:OmpA family protein n=1 Tax=Treponema sp. TaxID=166 RepID=UPI003F00E2C3
MRIFFLMMAMLFVGSVREGFCQETVLKYSGSGSYVYIERTDVRRYDNGKYTGLVSREVRSYIAPVSAPVGASAGDRYYDGSFFVDESTRRNLRETALGINGAVPSSFRISASGELVMLVDNGYPTFRSFPAFSTGHIRVGDKWQAKAERTVDPLNKGVFTKMPILVEYTYLKDEVLNGEEVCVFSAEWATRYGISYWDFGGDRDLKSAQGSHRATMYVSKRTGTALVVRDMVDETFVYADGNTCSFKGSISLFTEYPPAYDRRKLYPALQRIASVSEEELRNILEKPSPEKTAQSSAEKNSKSQESAKKSVAASAGSGSNLGSDAGQGQQAGAGSAKSASAAQGGATENSVQDSSSRKKRKSAEDVQSAVSNKTSASSGGDGGKSVVVENTSAGIRLTMQNLNFKPDSAELLPGENVRLDQIAQVLKEVPDQMFLVEGHTASVGYEKGEMRLSSERAEAVAKALIQRGIPREKFICKGSGGTKPIADNSTPEGKAKNRRVEITILE